MKKEVDLSKYDIRTDLALDYVGNNNYKNGIKFVEKNIDSIKVSTVTLNKKNDLNKKKGKYITIEFDDITDTDNLNKVSNILTKELKKLINIDSKSFGLIIGLGNDKSTPDSLGPKVIDNIIVTNHLFLLNELSKNYKRVAAINPGVMGETGIETSDIIESLVNKIKPDYLIVIDSLASRSIERINKTIQITDTGINPGSGIGNNRKEISKDTLGIPVYVIGVPTVVDIAVIVTDTLDYIKNNKNSLGVLDNLNKEETQVLINEILLRKGYNLMVTPKEIDFEINRFSICISKTINNLISNIDKKR